MGAGRGGRQAKPGSGPTRHLQSIAPSWPGPPVLAFLSWLQRVVARHSGPRDGLSGATQDILFLGIPLNVLEDVVVWIAEVHPGFFSFDLEGPAQD
jgi:hypothetical protein